MHMKCIHIQYARSNTQALKTKSETLKLMETSAGGDVIPLHTASEKSKNGTVKVTEL